MPEHDPSDPAASPLATPTPTPSLNGIAPPGAPRPRRLVYELYPAARAQTPPRVPLDCGSWPAARSRSHSIRAAGCPPYPPLCRHCRADCVCVRSGDAGTLAFVGVIGRWQRRAASGAGHGNRQRARLVCRRRANRVSFQPDGQPAAGVRDGRRRAERRGGHAQCRREVAARVRSI